MLPFDLSFSAGIKWLGIAEMGSCTATSTEVVDWSGVVGLPVLGVGWRASASSQVLAELLNMLGIQMKNGTFSMMLHKSLAIFIMFLHLG